MSFVGEATNTLDVLIAADQYGGPYTVYAPTVFREVICIQTTKPKPEMVTGKSNMRGFVGQVYTDLGYGYEEEPRLLPHREYKGNKMTQITDELLGAMKEADTAHTATKGIGGYPDFDAALKLSVSAYNGINGTNHDPYESLHLYLDHAEKQPWPDISHLQLG